MFQDIRPSPPPSVRAKPAAVPSQTAPVVPRRFAPPRTKKTVRRQRLVRLEKYGLIAAPPLVIIAMARLSAFPTIGEGVIGAYGLAALILRIPGRVSFWLASMAIVSIGVDLLLVPDVSRASNTALFVFLLLAVGLISLVFETKRIEAPHKPSRRR